jgi:hypothetical protein
MSTFFKPAFLGLGLVCGLAVAAQAQSVAVTPGPSIASLPPTDQGPRAYSHGYQGPVAPVAVQPSGAYPGPAPGAANGVMPPHYEKSADWDNDTALHPYTSGMGPKAH